MSTHKNINKICYFILCNVLILTTIIMFSMERYITPTLNMNNYENKLFSDLAVHTIDVIVDEESWSDLLLNASDKEYIPCNIVINDETFTNIAIRAKGNSSLQQVQSSDSNRYSFKVEFDHYDSSKSYYGLDKLCLNNIIQDNTYMKDYLIYTLMDDFGVPSPLVNYTTLKVNGEDFGLYLAVEAIEEAFLQRNYGMNYGYAYKPESESEMGGLNKSFNSIQSTSFISDSLGYDGNDYDNYNYIFDNSISNISNNDKDRLISSLEQLSKNENLEEVLDVEGIIRYFIVHNFALNFDSYTGSIMHNYYIYENDGILSMLPWDYNLSFASFMTSYTTEQLVNFPIDTPISTGTIDSRIMLSWIFNNDNYLNLYHELFNEFVINLFDSGYVYELITSVETLIDKYVYQDPTKFCDYDEFVQGVATLSEFISLRIDSISGQLEGTIPSTSSGQLEISTTLIDALHIDVTDTGSENSNNSKGDGIPSNNRGDVGMQNNQMDMMGNVNSMITNFSNQSSNSSGSYIFSIVILCISIFTISKYKKR